MRPKKLDDAAVAEWLAKHPAWKREGDALRREFRFPDYRKTIAFVVELALAAEKKDHHPDLLVGWGKVVVIWSTHDAGGVTDLDLELAALSDELST